MPACPAPQPLLSAPTNAALAQLVEHIIRNDGVTCSSHVSGTRIQKSTTTQRSNRTSAPDCDTRLSHKKVGQEHLNCSNSSKNRRSSCGTLVSHRRHCGLWRRGAVYQYRVRVPHDLIDRVGRTHINRSLKTASFTVATRLVRKVAFEIETYFDQVSVIEGGLVPRTVELRPERIVSPIVAHITPLAPAVLTLAEVSERYLNDPTSARTAKSEMIYRTTYATIIGIVGADVPAASINRETCREILDVLRRLPPNAKKRWPQMPPREVADMATAQGISPMSVANVNEYMNKLSTLFNWAVKEEMLTRNPARGLKIADGTAAREKRRPFSVQQLQRIFDAPIYRGCVDDERGFATIGKESPRRSRFWIPLIGLFAGMRLNEICQLHTSEVRKLDGIWCFIITVQGDDKRLKTASSERVVPVHPTLTTLGWSRPGAWCRFRR